MRQTRWNGLRNSNESKKLNNNNNTLMSKEDCVQLRLGRIDPEADVRDEARALRLELEKGKIAREWMRLYVYDRVTEDEIPECVWPYWNPDEEYRMHLGREFMEKKCGDKVLEYPLPRDDAHDLLRGTY